jgi:hypothetical protein
MPGVSRRLAAAAYTERIAAEIGEYYSSRVASKTPWMGIALRSSSARRRKNLRITF